MSNVSIYSVVITQTEWRSLLRLGVLRLSRRRVQEVHVPLSPKERDRLFAWAPTTEIGDANDTLVIELVENWVDLSKRHSAHSSELFVVELEQVSAHYSVSSESQSYLLDDALREGVELSDGRYESAWAEWVHNEMRTTNLAEAEALTRLFGIPVDLRRKRSDGYIWHDIIELARNSKTSIKPKPKHIEALLQNVRQISDASAGVHATAAFTLAVNIEWVSARLGKDPLTKRALRSELEGAIAEGRNVDWSVDPNTCPPVAKAIALLAETFPRAYSAGIGPEMVAITIRLLMAAKEETLDPIDVPVAVRFLLGTHDPESASNLCVALSGALGPTMTRRLRRAIQAINPMNLDWA